MSGAVTDLVSLLLLGFFLGMRHATDADHVIAIATIVSRQRTLRGSVLIGAAWGIGHTLTILAVGSAIILFGVVIPARVGLAMELAVGIMLVILGLLTLTGMGRVLRDAIAPGVPCWSMRTLTATTWLSTITPMRTATMFIGMPMATTPRTMVIRRIRPRWHGSTERSARSRSINGCDRSWSASCTGSRARRRSRFSCSPQCAIRPGRSPTCSCSARARSPA